MHDFNRDWKIPKLKDFIKKVNEEHVSYPKQELVKLSYKDTEEATYEIIVHFSKLVHQLRRLKITNPTKTTTPSTEIVPILRDDDFGGMITLNFVPILDPPPHTERRRTP